MSIQGINIAECNLCKECIKECPTSNFSINSTNTQILFDNSKGCLLCGHCIAVCPKGAIIYENMKDSTFEFEEHYKPISYDALYRVMRSKRSIRQFKNKKVTIELIEKVIDCMRYAPTGMNRRTLKCLLISDDKKIQEIIDLVINGIDIDEGKEEYKKKRDNGIEPFFYNAPHILILHSDNEWDSKNAPISITYAMLCAETLGLGSCWIGGIQIFLSEHKEIQKKILGNDNNIYGIIIIGYPAVKYFRGPPRPPIETKIISNSSN